MAEVLINKSPLIIPHLEENRTNLSSSVDGLLRSPNNSASAGEHFNKASQILRLAVADMLDNGKLNDGIGAELNRLNGRDIVDLGSGRNCPFQSVFDQFMPDSKIISVDLDETNFENYEGSPRNREFRKDDAQYLETIDDGTVAVVFESVLMPDNPDIDGEKVQEQIFRVLEEGGIYV